MKCLLVANRWVFISFLSVSINGYEIVLRFAPDCGEIAIRILSTARELKIPTIAVYVDSDRAHISHANKAIPLPNAAAFLDIPLLVKLCRQHNVDTVHPGYGFLSESAEFALALRRAGITFVGPSVEILRETGDKLKARQLADACKVPVLPALTTPTDNVSQLVAFGQDVGWPIMLKAVDGGGGRGIRLVQNEKELAPAFKRAVAESPSKTVFAERAAVGGWRHVEVQILGDGSSVMHFWERECSIQRRYQKVVEIAPATISNRELISAVIESAVRMASRISYNSLGTFEFLVSPSTLKYYFLEINPRLQVEHTITEALTSTDLVRLQLLVAQGASLSDLSLRFPTCKERPPSIVAMQLRVTAEDPERSLSLSIGKINSISLPGGNGVRVDTHIRPGAIISADFDSLLAKIVIASNDWDAAIAKGLRALEDFKIEGVTSNLSLLQGILLSRTFQAGDCDTQWLEGNIDTLLKSGKDMKARGPVLHKDLQIQSTPAASANGGGTMVIRKGDCWHVSLSNPHASAPMECTVKIARLFKNDFPRSLAAELSLSDPLSTQPNTYHNPCTIDIRQSQSSDVKSSGRRQGDSNNPSHLVCPLAGTLVEVLVEEGDVVQDYDAVAIVRQMKMELEVRAHRSGVVKNLWEMEEGEEVVAGMLVCEILDEEPLKEKL